MPGLSFNKMELLSAQDVERAYRVTDELLLNRDWVVVPLMCSDEGIVLQLPDGKILLRPPGGHRFEAWLDELPSKLRELELGRVPRPWHLDPKFELTGPGQVRLEGTRRYLPPHEGRPSEKAGQMSSFGGLVPRRKAG